MKTFPIIAGAAIAALAALFAPPADAAARVVNISTRLQVLTGDDVMIGGFIIGGTSPKTVIVRARGPSMASTGLKDLLMNPKLDLYSGQTKIASNDDWQSASNAAEIQASGYAPEDPSEAAILMSLPPGGYTAIVSGSSAGAGGATTSVTGVGIVEVFEVDATALPLVNIATRGRVMNGNDVMIAGFVIQGTEPQTVAVRARGPSLTATGVANALQDPSLQLLSGQTVIGSNDDWAQSATSELVRASGMEPASSLESVIIATLQPGAYTAIVTGKGGTTGVGIVEVFALAPILDKNPPTVQSTSPTQSAVGISIVGPVVVTFSEPVDPATLTSATFRLLGPGPVQIPATISVNGNTATLTPDVRLAISTSYSVVITTGVRDLAGNALAAQHSFAYTTSANEPPPSVAGCPAPEGTSQLRTLAWGATPVVRRKSGEITAIRVPQSPSGRASVAFTQGQTTVTPGNVTIDLTVSRCPGVIETDLHPACRATTNFANFTSITAFNRGLPQYGMTTIDQLAGLGCLAPDTEPQYINIRWTFPKCPWGDELCGFSLQWGEGSY